MAHKAFNEKDFTDFDQLARNKARRYLEDSGYSVEDNLDRFGVDLVCKCDHGKKFAVEVEVKKGWTGDFRFATLHIPFRKSKFINGSTLFFVFSSNLYSVAIVTSNTLKDSPIVDVPNYKIPEGEKFFDVPVNKIKLVKLTF